MAAVETKLGRWLRPEWPAPAHVHAVSTLRCSNDKSKGGCRAPFDAFNLATHVGDVAADVIANRQYLVEQLSLPSEPCWLSQVHGTDVLMLDDDLLHADNKSTPEADASCTRSAGVVCTVLTADCLPLLLCDRAGHNVAAVHAGWRGLAAGVIEQTIKTMAVPGRELYAWLGPAIGVDAFEVGDDVRDTFIGHHQSAADAFVKKDGRWHADLYMLARQRLAACGVTAVFGGEYCTYRDSEYFYSFRRDGETGRMASLIWIDRN